MPRSSNWSLFLRSPHQNPVHASSIPVRATCPVKLIILYVITRIMFGEVYRSLCSSLCGLHHSPVTSSLLGPNIFLSTLFSKALILCSSLDVTDQLSHPDMTTGKIVVLYYLIFIFLVSKPEDKKDSAPTDCKHPLSRPTVCNPYLLSMSSNLWYKIIYHQTPYILTGTHTVTRKDKQEETPIQ